MLRRVNRPFWFKGVAVRGEVELTDDEAATFASFLAPLPVEDKPDPPKLRIGSRVNWISQGVQQNSEPLKIKGFSEDRLFVFVEGTDTGIPAEQVEKV